MANLTYNDMFDLINEIERGAKDKTRTLSSVTNPIIKDILNDESSMALAAGVTTSILGTGLATGALIGTIGGAGTGVVGSSLTALGVTALSATSGSVIGAATGSFVPGIGTVIGAGVGLILGLIVDGELERKENEERALLYQEVIKKQNTYIRDLEKELNELKEKYGKKVEQNERYKYIISLLMANEELKKAA